VWQIGRLVDEAAANADDASSRLHAAAAARDRAARARAPVTPATTATDYTHTSDSDFDEEPSLAATQAVVAAEPAGAGNTSPSQLSLFNLRTAARAERAAAAAQEGPPRDMAAAAAALGAAAVAAVAAAPGQFVEAASARVQGGVCRALMPGLWNWRSGCCNILLIWGVTNALGSVVNGTTTSPLHGHRLTIAFSPHDHRVTTYYHCVTTA
jgi:hypothetical protein